jgi:hypothetical protein
MFRLIFWGIGLVVVITGFSVWRGGVLRTLPEVNPGVPASTPDIPPFEAERKALLEFEERNLAAKAKRIGTSTAALRENENKDKDKGEGNKNKYEDENKVMVRTSVAPNASALAPQGGMKNEDKNKNEGVPAAATTSQPVQAMATPTSSPTTTARSAPAPAPERQKFLIEGLNFCHNDRGAAIDLSGYPLVTDASVPPADIIEWTTTRVRFYAPAHVPPGTYTVTVRGVDKWGYCTAVTSTPRMITIK